MLTEAQLHVKRHKRVLASRSRIAYKARRDATLRSEARNKHLKSAQFFQDIGLAQKKAEREAVSDQAAALAAAKQHQAKQGWVAGAAAKAMSFLRRGR